MYYAYVINNYVYIKWQILSFEEEKTIVKVFY